jgi:hypothetical protein
MGRIICQVEVSLTILKMENIQTDSQIHRGGYRVCPGLKEALLNGSIPDIFKKKSFTHAEVGGTIPILTGRSAGRTMHLMFPPPNILIETNNMLNSQIILDKSIVMDSM